MRALPHGALTPCRFHRHRRTRRQRGAAGRRGDRREAQSVRSTADDSRAEVGAEVRQGATVTALTAPRSESEGWRITAGAESFHVRVLVAADGRNSTIARLLGLLPRITKERVALQTHLPLPAGFGDRVVLQFLREGYSGQAPIGNGELNLCLVGKPATMPALRDWAERKFGLPQEHYLAHDHAAATGASSSSTARSLPGRRRGARGRAIYRRRDLLCASFRRIGRRGGSIVN